MYRDDLEAALARIAALEGELREATRDGQRQVSAERSEAERERSEVEQENLELRRDNDQLRGQLGRARQQLAQLREERDRLVERVRVLQRSRDDAARRTGAAPTGAARPARAAPAPAGARPTVWEHNRALPTIKRGEPAGVWCPSCRAAGKDVQMVRHLGRFVRDRGDDDYESVACPRCLFTALARRR